jgi:mannosyltransferase OCH1-like enzyme
MLSSRKIPPQGVSVIVTKRARPYEIDSVLHLVNPLVLEVTLRCLNNDNGWNTPFNIIIQLPNTRIVRRIKAQDHSNELTFQIKLEESQALQSEPLDSPQFIPKKIFQSFDSLTNLSPSMKATVLSWIEKNPEYEYHFYSDADGARFIKEHYGAKVLEAYNTIIPGAFKCDLLRNCLLHKYGGVYADCKTICQKRLSSIIDPEETSGFTWDFGVKAIYNGFFYTVPENPLLLYWIEQVTNDILARSYGKSTMDITGPKALTRHGQAFVGTGKKIGLEFSSAHLTIQYKVNKQYCFQKLDNRIAIKKNPSNYYDTVYKTKRHYKHYWHTKTLYTDDFLRKFRSLNINSWVITAEGARIEMAIDTVVPFDMRFELLAGKARLSFKPRTDVASSAASWEYDVMFLYMGRYVIHVITNAVSTIDLVL